MLDTHGNTLNQGRVNVLTSSPATLILPANPKRCAVHIQATDINQYVFLGNSSIVLGQGIGIIGALTGTFERQVATLHTKAAIYGMAEDNAQNVTYLEEAE